MDRMPAVSLVAMPGRRVRTLELAKEIEDRGFIGIFGPSFGDLMALSVSLGHVTERIPFGTSIQPIQARKPADLAQTASYAAEVSEGRFHLGIGVSHGRTTTPLKDTRAYVEALDAAWGEKAVRPTLVLATLRQKMLQLALELADGAVWANASRSHMPESLRIVDRDDFFVGNMVPTVIDEDRDAARAVHRKTLSGYVTLPNYRNYWKEAGYVEEMEAIEKALDAGDRDAVVAAMHDRWLDDVTLSGSAAQVREGIDAWFDAGVTTPIVVPSSTSGGQLKAIEEIFAACS
ncbi:MAG TPA: LLM class flavin-dependent oxidoreductase [Acidimicrobiales bacterium]|nr:LLM class flavin-dependent oxidoreductase [Acidimicrobiales bacterium]